VQYDSALLQAIIESALCVRVQGCGGDQHTSDLKTTIQVALRRKHRQLPTQPVMDEVLPWPNPTHVQPITCAEQLYSELYTTLSGSSVDLKSI
jgi:hypothetical protein